MACSSRLSWPPPSMKDHDTAIAINEARRSFMAAEESRGAELRGLIAAQDEGDGEMTAIADEVRTAADYQAELPFPAQGLPSYTGVTLRLRRFVERPLSLHTSWLLRLPPQSVPPGFKPKRIRGDSTRLGKAARV